MPEKSSMTFMELFHEAANSKAVVDARKTAVANRIKMLRIEKGLSHAEVAKGTMIKVMTYSGYENAHNNTPIESLVRLAIFYDVSLDYLCCRTDKKKGCYTESEAKPDNELIAELMTRVEALEAKGKDANSVE